MLTGNGLHHGQRRFALSRARRLGHPRIHQAMAFLHERMPQATEFGFLPLRLLIQSGIEIGSGSIRGIGAPLPVEVNAGIAGIVWGSESVSATLGCGFSTLIEGCQGSSNFLVAYGSIVFALPKYQVFPTSHCPLY